MENKIKIIRTISSVVSFVLFLGCIVLTIIADYDNFSLTQETIPLAIILGYSWAKLTDCYYDAVVIRTCAFILAVWFLIHSGFTAVVVYNSFYLESICNLVFYLAFFVFMFCEYVYKKFEKKYKPISIVLILIMALAFVGYILSGYYDTSHIVIMAITLADAVLLSLAYKLEELSRKKYVYSREKDEEVSDDGIEG